MLKSDKNPSNFTKIPGIPKNANPLDKKYANALKAWNESCEKYEEKANKKTAKKFGITVDEVYDIFISQATAPTNEEPTEDPMAQ